MTAFLTTITSAIAALLLLIRPWGAPGIQVVKVTIPECKDEAVPEIRTIRKTLSADDRDILVWRITNKCGHQARVAIESAEPAPILCVGEPRTATVDSTFSLGGRKTAYLICTVAYPPCHGDPKACREVYKYRVSAKVSSGYQTQSVSEIEINVDP